MNEIINKFLLTWDKFTPESHLKQPGFAFSACGSFTKHRERIGKFRKFRNLKYLYRNELEKTWFTHDAAYSDSKHLGKRTIARGGPRNFQKGGGELYVRHHGWLTKKILGFRWSKKAKITLKNVFGEMFLSVFLNCLYFYILWKPCRWNLINFSKFTNTLVRKEKKHPYRSQREKKNWVKLDFAL